MAIETILDPAHWMEWRRTGIGASEAAAVAGQSNRPTRMEVWLDKIGRSGPCPEPSEQMRWGHRLEDDIADAYSEATGIQILITQVCCRSDSHPFMIATLDGVTDDRNIEFKVCGHWASRTLGESGDTETLPLHWLIQVQHQMEVSGKDRTDIAVFLPTLELRIYPVFRSNLLIDSLIEIESEFWEHVKSETPPPASDPSDYEHVLRYRGNAETRVALDHNVIMAVDMYQHACAEIKELELMKDQARAEIIAALGSNKYGDLPDGRVVTASVAQISERTQIVKAHTQVRLSIRAPKPATVNTD
jgi:putative phage-type endonuclease